MFVVTPTNPFTQESPSVTGAGDFFAKVLSLQAATAKDIENPFGMIQLCSYLILSTLEIEHFNAGGLG